MISLHALTDAPGFKPADIKVELQDKALVVSGKHQQESEQQEGKMWHSERRFHQFSRSFILPDNAKPEEITASLVSMTVGIPE